MFEVKLLPDAAEGFGKLDRALQIRLGLKIEWLSKNAAAMVHHPLTSLPDDLQGLCKLSTGLFIGCIMQSNEFLYTLLNIEAKITNH